ncbi:MAG: 30S ribosomal protein S9 [Candidatus Omnitrophica bacterium]|nr:30S ribosomal protein S9 [Candidatus Omnitrophota bacterium]
MSDTKYYATGRRKTATARVWLKEGDGIIEVNGLKMEDFFGRADLRMIIQQPFEVTKSENRFDIKATVRGGGESGQAGALRHGIARVLVKFDISWKTLLRKAGLLTRDPRKKERKKYGRKGARRAFQFTKR